MDELKHLTNKNDPIQISGILHKIYNKIQEQLSKKVPEKNIKEIDYLLQQCSSKNQQLSLLTCHTIVRLVEAGNLSSSQILAQFLSLVNQANYNQYVAISEAIVNILLIDLRTKTLLGMDRKNKDLKQDYVCPFGLNRPQHPLIVLLNANKHSIHDVAIKIKWICQHHDVSVRKNSIEFVRPVCLYVLCDSLYPSADATRLWMCVLDLNKQYSEVDYLIREIFRWSRKINPESCLETSIRLIDTIDSRIEEKNRIRNIKLPQYLGVIIYNLINNGFDPQPGLRTLLTLLHRHEKIINLNPHFIEELLYIFGVMLLHISPRYLPNLLGILKFIIIENNWGNNKIILHIILFGLMQWMAIETIFTSDYQVDVNKLMDFIIKKEAHINKPDKMRTQGTLRLVDFDNIDWFDGDVRLISILVSFSDRLITGSNTIDRFMINIDINKTTHISFCKTIYPFLCGLWLLDDLSQTSVEKCLKIFLKIVQFDRDLSSKILPSLLFKLSKSDDVYILMEILKVLTQFAVLKENIPKILNVLRTFTVGALKLFAMDLYLKLWECENRTYKFLYKLIATEPTADDNLWEYYITKASIMENICNREPTHHGKELISHLSDILNNCSSIDGDLATSIALNTITTLCESNTINISSTWKVLGVKFEREKRPRTCQSLCNFFGKVPLLPSPTSKYENLFIESIKTLWNFIIWDDRESVISAALQAMKNFPPDDIPFHHVPEKFRGNIKLPKLYANMIITNPELNSVDVLPYIPGECWLRLLQNINPIAISAASQLLVHLIENEIKEFRSGVYALPEGVAEPKSLQQLQHKSVLKAVTNFLIEQSKVINFTEYDKIILLYALKSISAKFSKPLPPLNWFFLIEFMDRCDVGVRIECVKICANQLKQSGSARNLIENYVTCFPTNLSVPYVEVLNVVNIIPDIFDCIANVIFNNFLHIIFKYYFVDEEAVEWSIVEQLKEALKLIFNKDMELYASDNMKHLISIFQIYFELINIQDEKKLSEYLNLLSCLPERALEQIIPTKSNWKSIDKDDFNKIVLLKFILCNRHTSPMPLVPIIENVIDLSMDQDDILRKVTLSLQCINNDLNLFNWTMYIISKIQMLINKNSVSGQLNDPTITFLINVFVISVNVISGCLNLEIESMKHNEPFNNQIHLNIFPTAIYILCSGYNIWNDQVPKISEFLLSVYNNYGESHLITNAFFDAIICLKNQPHFNDKNILMKFIGLRKK